jgi:hypothetical protein
VISEGDPSAFHKTAVSTAIQTDRYTCPATLGVTIVPSGGTTTKNGFNGPGVAECSALSPLMEESSLAISDRIKLPNEKVVFLLSSLSAAAYENAQSFLHSLAPILNRILPSLGRV